MYYNNQVEQGAETLVFRRLKARLLLKRFQLSQNTSRKHFSFPETSIFYCNKKKTEKKSAFIHLTWICQTSLTELYLLVTVGANKQCPHKSHTNQAQITGRHYRRYIWNTRGAVWPSGSSSVQCRWQSTGSGCCGVSSLEMVEPCPVTGPKHPAEGGLTAAGVKPDEPRIPTISHTVTPWRQTAAHYKLKN